MRGFFLRWAIYTVSLMLAASIIPGITIDRWETTVVAALALGLANAFLRPILILFTLPLNILSLGIFTLVINAFLFYGVSRLVPGFAISGFSSAFFGSLALSAISFTFNCIIRPTGSVDLHWYRYPQQRRQGGGRSPGRVIDVEASPDDGPRKDKK